MDKTITLANNFVSLFLSIVDKAGLIVILSDVLENTLDTKITFLSSLLAVFEAALDP